MRTTLTRYHRRMLCEIGKGVIRRCAYSQGWLECDIKTSYFDDIRIDYKVIFHKDNVWNKCIVSFYLQDLIDYEIEGRQYNG